MRFQLGDSLSMAKSNFIMRPRQISFRFITKFCLLIVCSTAVKNAIVVESRTVPVSRPIRFPTSSEDAGNANIFDATPQFIQRKHQNLTPEDFPSTQPRTAVFANKHSVPLSAFLSEKEKKKVGEDLIDSSGEDLLSSEVIVIDADPILNEKPRHPHEDEDLGFALCPSNNNLDGNETISENEGGDRTPTVLNMLRYDLRAGKCGKVGGKEHCGENMIFVAEIDSAAYGYCECDFQNKNQTEKEEKQGLITTTPLVFHPETNACYRLYEQAYCKQGEWLILSRKIKGPVCEERKCPSSSKAETGRGNTSTSRRRASKLLTPEFWTDKPTATAKGTDIISRKTSNDKENTQLWVPLNGSGPCVQLYEKSLEFCEKDELVLFSTGDIVPKCRIPGREVEGRATLIRNACPAGSYYSIIGRCQPDWDF